MAPVRLVGLALVAGLLGAPLGLAWVALAPTADVTVQAGEPAGIDVGEALVGSDATLLLVLAVPALVAGLVAGRRGTREGPALPLCLALGVALASVVAWQVGSVVGTSRGEELLAAAPDGAVVAVNLELRAYGVLVAPVLLAVLAQLLVALRSDPPEVRGPDVPGPDPEQTRPPP